MDGCRLEFLSLARVDIPSDAIIGLSGMSSIARTCSRHLSPLGIPGVQADGAGADWCGLEFPLLRDSRHANHMCRDGIVLAGAEPEGEGKGAKGRKEGRFSVRRLDFKEGRCALRRKVGDG